MNEPLRKHPGQSANWLNFILGLWVFVSPFVMGFSDSYAIKWNNIATGLAILLQAVGPSGANRAGSVFNALLGGWLIVSPFALGFSSPEPFWNNIIVGIAIFIASIVAATHRPIHIDAGGPPTPH